MAFNRKSKAAGGGGDADAFEVLDSREQDAIVDDLEKDVVDSEAHTRRIFRMVYRAISVIFFVVFLLSLRQPMQMDHQNVFKDKELPFGQYKVTHEYFLVFYILSSLNFFTFSNFIKDKTALPSWTWHLALLSMFLIMFFWGYLFYHHNVTNYALYWLPFSNVGGFLLALYVDRDFNSARSSLDSLSKSKYQFNKP